MLFVVPVYLFIDFFYRNE